MLQRCELTIQRLIERGVELDQSHIIALECAQILPAGKY
jgi:hypothetical protein